MTTLSHRVAGTQQSYRASHKDQQLFTLGEESDIVNHCMIMADCGFPLSHALLRSIAQDILNDHLQATTTSATMTTNTHTIGVDTSVFTDLAEGGAGCCCGKEA